MIALLITLHFITPNRPKDHKLQFHPDHEYSISTGHTKDKLIFEIVHNKNCRKCKEECDAKH
jgi:hypothetical protein